MLVRQAGYTNNFKETLDMQDALGLGTKPDKPRFENCGTEVPMGAERIR
jgi:hypothetical protein